MKSWLRKYRLLWIPPVVILLGILLYRPLLVLEQAAADYVFFCPLHDLTGLYCPGCGGTRSLTALLHGKPDVPIDKTVIPGGSVPSKEGKEKEVDDDDGSRV